MLERDIQYWACCGCSDPTTQGPGETQAIVKDPAKPPVGDNLKSAKLDVLVRPYPQLIAGSPSGWKLDPSAKVFALDYSTKRADGGSFGGQPLTEVFVPKRQYPHGYSVQVQGAGVASRRGDQVLALRACPGAGTVKLRVAPSGTSSADCAVAPVLGARTRLTTLRLSVKPRRAHRGRATTFVFRISAGRFAVRGAGVRFAGHSACTNATGRARMRVRLKTLGLHLAVAWKRTFRSGATRIRVVR